MIFFFKFTVLELHQNFTCVRALQSKQLRLGEAKHVVWCTVTVWRFLHVSGGISQVAVWLPIKNEPWLLNYRLALLAMMAVLMCHSPLSLSKSLCPPPPLPSSTGLFIFVSISLTSTLLAVSLHLSVDCNKTLALQFMFAPLAPSPAQPQLLPVVHGSGSLPSAKGIYG